MNGHHNLLILLATIASNLLLGNAFSPFVGSRRLASVGPVRSEFVVLDATPGGKKRKRRRKQSTAAGSEESAKKSTPAVMQETPKEEKSATKKVADPADASTDEEEIDVAQLVDIAKFKFEGSKDVQGDEESAPEKGENAIQVPLPDISQVLKRKELEQELARMEEEKESQKVKIKRSDKKALLKLLEQDPYADADDSFFEEEEYGTVSALLGERAAPFLGIPTGPLQVGHFIGALVIVLMAFVEYPGFPLTNLPTPLREALQGGLGTVYLINIVLAVLAVFKAGERGQPAFLWVAKTFTVGGLAFDQLTQLPTLEQVEKAKAQKGKRALKNRKKY